MCFPIEVDRRQCELECDAKHLRFADTETLHASLAADLPSILPDLSDMCLAAVGVGEDEEMTAVEELRRVDDNFDVFAHAADGTDWSVVIASVSELLEPYAEYCHALVDRIEAELALMAALTYTDAAVAHTKDVVAWADTMRALLKHGPSLGDLGGLHDEMAHALYDPLRALAETAMPEGPRKAAWKDQFERLVPRQLEDVTQWCAARLDEGYQATLDGLLVHIQHQTLQNVARAETLGVKELPPDDPLERDLQRVTFECQRIVCRIAATQSQERRATI